MRKNILYRLKLVICFLFTVIFLISCDNKAKLNNNELISLVEDVGTFKLKEFKPVMNQSEDIRVKNFNNEMIIFSTFYSPEIADKDNISQYFYSTGKTVNLGSVKPMIVSSESKIEKDNIVYTTDCVNIDNTAVNIIYKTDIEKQEISNLMEIKDMMPLSYLFDLDKNHILYYCVSSNGNNIYHYYINKNTKKLKKYIIEAENDNRRVQYYECDNDGNILVWTSDNDSYKDFNYYIIENSKIN